MTDVTGHRGSLWKIGSNRIIFLPLARSDQLRRVVDLGADRCAADRCRARTSRPAWRRMWDNGLPTVASGSGPWRSYLAIMQFRWAPALVNFDQKEINSSPEHQLTCGPGGWQRSKGARRDPPNDRFRPSKPDPTSSHPGECAPGHAPGCRSPKQQPP